MLNRLSGRKDGAVRFLRYVAGSKSLVHDMERSLLLPALADLSGPDSQRSAFLRRLAECYEGMELEIGPFSPGTALLFEEQLHAVFGEATGKRELTPGESCRRMSLRLEFEMSRRD